MELELYGLKFETSYDNKTYIIEANDYYCESDETKWLVTCENKVLTKDYEFNDDQLMKSAQFVFDTKDKAIETLKIYLGIEDRVNKEVAKYKKNIEQLETDLDLEPITDQDYYTNKSTQFMSLSRLTSLLECKTINSNYVTEGCSALNGVQIRASTVYYMLLIEQVIKEIEEETDYKVVNYFNYKFEHIAYSWPLYYYWGSNNYYVRQFAFIKKSEYSK